MINNLVNDFSQKTKDGNLRERVTEFERALVAYNNLITSVPEVRIHFALSLAHLVYNINKDLMVYLDGLNKCECSEVLDLDWKKYGLKCKWLNFSQLVSDLKTYGRSTLKDFGITISICDIEINTSLDILHWLEENVNTMNNLLLEVKNKLKDAPRGLYKNFFIKLYDEFDQGQTTIDYEEWEMRTGKMTFDRLKTKHTTVVADFLKLGGLRYALQPTKFEIEQVELEKVERYLEQGYVIPNDFVIFCAKFKRFASWEGEVLVLDKDVMGKYLYQFYYKLNSVERRSFFELVTTLNLIHQSMAKVKHEVAEQLKLAEDITLENTKYFAFANHVKKVMFSEEMTLLIADKRFTRKYMGQLVDDLMLSEHGDMIVDRWLSKSKHKTLIGNFFGCLKSAGIIEGSNLGIAQHISAIAIDKNYPPKTFASYMGRCGDLPCCEWICEYVKLDKSVRQSFDNSSTEK